jgi:hypothetical protein
MKKSNVKEQKSQDKPKVFKDNRKEKRQQKRSLYMFLQKSDDEIKYS